MRRCGDGGRLQPGGPDAPSGRRQPPASGALKTLHQLRIATPLTQHLHRQRLARHPSNQVGYRTGGELRHGCALMDEQTLNGSTAGAAEVGGQPRSGEIEVAAPSGHRGLLWWPSMTRQAL